MNEFLNPVITSYPKIEKITFKKIHKDYLKIILMNVLCCVLISLLVAYFVVQKILAKKLPDFITPFYILLFVVIISLTIVLIIGFKKRKYAVRDKDISYKSGLLFKTITTVPFSRVQHLEIDEGVFSRIFQLASLSVYTAGDSIDDLEIRGIKKEEAIQIKEFISSKING